MTPNRLISHTLQTAIISLVLIWVWFPPASAQMAPALKSSIQVTGEMVRIGDLFDNAGPAADVAVFRAPAPGTSGTVRADRLLEAARRHGVDWTNPHGVHQVQVSRDGLLIAEQDIKQLIVDTLLNETNSSVPGSTFEIEFSGDQSPLYVPVDKTAEAEIVSLRYSRRSARLSVTISAPAGDPAAKTYRYSGRAIAVASIPVVVRTVRRGSVISPDDVEMRNVPLRRIDNATLQDLEEVSGMEAKRTLRASQPIRARDIQRPQLVRQNEEVTVKFDAPGLSLTVLARSLQSGAKGEVINIRNMQSNRIVQGEIIGAGLVRAIITNTQLIARAN